MLLKRFSLHLATCQIPIKVFAELDESDAKEFVDADNLWSMVKQDVHLANRVVLWFSIRGDYLLIRLKPKKSKRGEN